MKNDYDELIADAKQILSDLGCAGRSGVSDAAAFTLLALAGIQPGMSWAQATNAHLTTRKGVMARIERLGKVYAENSRETIRKQGLNALIAAGLVVKNPGDPKLSQNSSLTHYALTSDALASLRRFGTAAWARYAENLHGEASTRAAAEQRKRSRHGTTIALPDGTSTILSPGNHGNIIASVIEDFTPRFLTDAELLYVADTARRIVWLADKRAKQLGITIDPKRKLPDVVVYEASTGSLVLIEAVDSNGEISDQRVVELTAIFSSSKLRLVFVTSFSSFNDFKKFSANIAWDTDIWIADEIGHMIHYNGRQFLSRRG